MIVGNTNAPAHRQAEHTPRETGLSGRFHRRTRWRPSALVSPWMSHGNLHRSADAGMLISTSRLSCIHNSPVQLLPFLASLFDH